MDDERILFTSGLKAMGGGKVGGYLVRYSDENTPDLDGDFFTKATDFDVEEGDRVTVYYQHGLDPVLKTRKLGKGTVRLHDDVGVWVEAQLELRDEYEKAIYQMAEDGRLGWSSGTLPNLVAAEPTKTGARWIKSWPLGKDASLTPNPAAGPEATRVSSMKSLIDSGYLKSAAVAAAKEQISMNTDEIMETAEAQEAPQAAPLTIDAIKAAFSAEIEPLKARLERIEKTPVNQLPAAQATPVLKHARGDSHANAFKAWVQTGDGGGLYIPKGDEASYTIKGYSLKASNATDMNIGTAADGGNMVPTGFLNQIIARRDESSLLARLPLRAIPGVGTTVDVPLDGEADGEFVSTNEAATFDQDAPAIGKKSLTLVKYTKYTDVSYELLEDTPVALESFLADFVGRGLAKTYNNLILTEVASNGTNFKTFTGTGAIAFGEPEDIVGNDDLANYLAEDNAAAWVTRSSTHWDIKSIVGTDRQYAINGDNGMTLLGYPVIYSQKVAAMAASAKSIYFGNWRYVGYREAPGLTFLRNPYSAANSGQVRLHWYVRFVAGVLQAEAIGYGTQAAS